VTRAALVFALALFAAGAQASEPFDLALIVDVNRATAGELAELPGLGPRRAAAIVELRKRRPFRRVTQLLEVKGIGKKTFQRLKPWVRVSAEGSPTQASVEASVPTHR
jgi:competence protein ComEA